MALSWDDASKLKSKRVCWRTVWKYNYIKILTVHIKLILLNIFFFTNSACVLQDGENIEEEMGLAGAAAEDAESEYIRKICECEVVTGRFDTICCLFCRFFSVCGFWLGKKCISMAKMNVTLPFKKMHRAFSTSKLHTHYSHFWNHFYSLNI